MTQDFNIYIIEDTISGSYSLPLFLASDIVAKQEFYKFVNSFKDLPASLIPDYRIVRIGDYHASGEGSYLFSTKINYVLAGASTDFSMQEDCETSGIDFYLIPYKSSTVVSSTDDNEEPSLFDEVK